MDFESGRNAGPSAYLPVEVRAGWGRLMAGREDACGAGMAPS